MFVKKSISRLFLVLIAAVLISGWIGPAHAAPLGTVKLIFIHHSTGENWLRDDYGILGNTLDANNYFVSDTNYGWGPDSIGDRTDIPDWLEWFRSPSTPTYVDALLRESSRHSSYTRTKTNPGGENKIVMFKSCFPNSNLEGSPTDPPDSTPGYTVGHAKYVYNEILKYFRTRPDILFVVITAPPVSDATYAANARAFNNWLLDTWLTENAYPFSNVAVFDFYNVLTHTDAHHRYDPATGSIEHVITSSNTLYYPSSPGDDHPNVAGSQKATTEFVPLLNIFYNRWKTNDLPQTIQSLSNAAQDGWVLESTEISNKGGTNNSISTTFKVGDDVSNRQYRGILSFDTSSIPDTAIVTGVTLKVKKAGLVGTNPIRTHDGLRVDIHRFYFGIAPALQRSDFQAKASKNLVGRFSNTAVSGWYTANLGSAAYPYINKTGATQFRLRFYKDDNNDFGADCFKFYSGNAGAVASPQLIVEYYIP